MFTPSKNTGITFTGVVEDKPFKVKVKPEEKQSYIDAVKQQIQDSLIRREVLRFLV